MRKGNVMFKNKVISNFAVSAMVISLSISAIPSAKNTQQASITKAKQAVNLVAVDPNGESKIGYFDSQVVLKKSKYGHEFLKEIEEKREKYANEVKRAETDYTNKLKDYEAKNSMLSISAREEKRKELIKMKRDIENLAKGYDDDFKLEMNQKQMKIEKVLFDAVIVCGKREQKDIIVDVKTGMQYPINDKIDMSEVVIADLDKIFEAEFRSLLDTKMAKVESESDKKTA